MNGTVISTPGPGGNVEQWDLKSYEQNYGAHRVGITMQEMKEYYNRWAQIGTYEKDLGPVRYRGPQYAAETILKYLKDNKDMEIIDVAAGTGFVGEQNMGFTNVDALDPAQSMLDVAEKKHVYRKYLCDFLGGKEVYIADDDYDALVISGGLGEGHIPCRGIKEMIRIVRPGGIVVIVMRKEYLEYVKEYMDRLEPLMEELAMAGQWKSLERTIVPQYSFNNEGIIFVFKVTVQGYSASNTSVI